MDRFSVHSEPDVAKQTEQLIDVMDGAHLHGAGRDHPADEGAEPSGEATAPLPVADPRPYRAQQPPVRRPRLRLHRLDEAVRHGADRRRRRLGKPLYRNQRKRSMGGHRQNRDGAEFFFCSETYTGVRGLLVVAAAADGDGQAAVGALPRAAGPVVILPLPVPRSSNQIQRDRSCLLSRRRCDLL